VLNNFSKNSKEVNSNNSKEVNNSNSKEVNSNSKEVNSNSKEVNNNNSKEVNNSNSNNNDNSNSNNSNNSNSNNSNNNVEITKKHLAVLFATTLLFCIKKEKPSYKIISELFMDKDSNTYIDNIFNSINDYDEEGSNIASLTDDITDGGKTIGDIWINIFSVWSDLNASINSLKVTVITDIAKITAYNIDITNIDNNIIDCIYNTAKHFIDK